jgi:hypothetical protein
VESERGQAAAEWLGIVGVVALVFAALGAAAAGGTWRLGEGVLHTIVCNAGGWCEDSAALERAYGHRTSELVRRLAPLIVYERGSAQLPVDFRRCRRTSCSDGADRAVPIARSELGQSVTAFTRVLDERGSGGSLYIQYWLYFPESFTGGIARKLGRFAKLWPGFHADDWEGFQVRVQRGGKISSRASAHGSYRGFKDSAGWGPWTGIYRVSGGSHAGHLVTAPTGERETRPADVDLVPLETLPYPDLSRFEVSPPWRKEVFREPESGSS